jgi:hypothetical protein
VSASRRERDSIASSFIFAPLSLRERRLLPHGRRLKLTAGRVSNISGAKIGYLIPFAAFIKPS